MYEAKLHSTSTLSLILLIFLSSTCNIYRTLGNHKTQVSLTLARLNLLPHQHFHLMFDISSWVLRNKRFLQICKILQILFVILKTTGSNIFKYATIIWYGNCGECEPQPFLDLDERRKSCFWSVIFCTSAKFSYREKLDWLVTFIPWTRPVFTVQSVYFENRRHYVIFITCSGGCECVCKCLAQTVEENI